MELRSAIAVVSKASPQNVYGLLPLRSHINSTTGNTLKKKRRVSGLVIRASNSGDYRFDSDHGMVDANMIILRKRIFELGLEEGKNELPREWTDWEKKMHPYYISNVFLAIGWLQNYLMTARPSVAVAVLSLVSVCVPTSVFLATLAGVHCVEELIAGFPLTPN